MTEHSQPPHPTAPHGASRTSPEAASAGTRFDRLVDIMRRLRSPTGCPWDRAQTLASLRPFVLEETYEVLDALDRDDHAELKGELGDLLFQVVFLSHLCTEAGSFTVADAIDAIADKLIRRHPHVFGEPDDQTGSTQPVTPGEVRGRWEQLKAEERADTGRPQRLLSGVPATLPALLRAYEIGSRVATVGFDWPDATDVVDKVDEEVGELRQAVEAGVLARTEEEMGDLLFSIANLSRKLGIEPEAALRRANTKFCDRVSTMEHRFQARGRTLHDDVTTEEMEVEWRVIKDEEVTPKARTSD